MSTYPIPVKYVHDADLARSIAVVFTHIAQTGLPLQVLQNYLIMHSFQYHKLFRTGGENPWQNHNNGRMD